MAAPARARYGRSSRVSTIAVVVVVIAMMLVTAVQVTMAAGSGALPAVLGSPTRGGSTTSSAVGTPPASLLLPPVNAAIMKDPSGTYNFTYLGNRMYSADLATYERLLRDPASGIAASNVQIMGTTVIMVTPEENARASAPNANGPGWSGAGGGYCTFSVGGSGSNQNINCSNPQDTLYYSTVMEWALLQ